MKQISSNAFLTIVVREDLTPGCKVAQSVHAVADFAAKSTSKFLKWQCNSNYVCCLEASQFKIEKILDKLDDLKIKYHVFFEPDMDNQMTAFAVEALPRNTHKKLFKNLKLTLS